MYLEANRIGRTGGVIYTVTKPYMLPVRQKKVKLKRQNNGTSIAGNWRYDLWPPLSCAEAVQNEATVR